MELKVALIASVVIQFLAFIITISLIPKTKFNIAWISISIGFFLMALRRLIEVYTFYLTDTSSALAGFSSWVAVVISVAMLIASIYIRKIFEVINRLQTLRKENEARLLSAIISTEEKERKNFSKELHDGLGPLLSSAKMILSAIDRTHEKEQNNELLNKVETMVDSAIVTTKEISNNLTPHLLERYGLKKAVDTFVRNTIARNSIQIDVSSNIGEKRYQHNVEVTLYRICCELINNSLKYASATKITILLSSYSNTVELNYDDNGKGFVPGKQDSNGMGLTNIKSRVKSLNGSITMESAPGNGFYVNIKLPV
jgi:signal transduction histidine kinase